MVKCKECETQACYGIKDKQPEYCLSHKKSDMIDIINKTCKFENCKTRPTYGIKSTKLAEYCKLHKKIDMIDVLSKKCKHRDCYKQPFYGFKGKQAEYCTLHKKLNMVDLKNKKCLECDKIPNYGISGSKNAQYCNTHKKANMVDIKNKKCLECSKQPIYAFKGKQAQYCYTHKKIDMVDVKNKKCLECSKQPAYGIKGKQAQYCATHKKDGMVDILHKTCKNIWCETRIGKKYDGYCYFCFVHMFPDHELTRSYKTKEKAVVDFVKTEFPDITFICDKQIYDGCSKKRPDMFADFGDWVLIIEVDENEHIGYTCENKRLMQLSKDINHRPLRMIRFNPDKYIRNDIKTASCWRNTKKGTLLVKTKQSEWETRLDMLRHKIQKSIDNPPDMTISLCNLYFSK